MLDAGLPLVAFLQLVRVYGQALAQIADAEVKLFHLYVHEPMIRDGVPVLDIAEELVGPGVRAAAAGAARSWTASTSGCCSTSSSRTSSATSRPVADDGRARPRARRDRVRRPRRLHAADRGGGRGGGARGRRALRRRSSSETLPDDARVIKTIGDEVMVVGTDAARARRLGGRVPGAVDRAPAAADRPPRRQRALPRRRLLRARGQPRRRASARAPPAARCWSRARSRTPPGRHLRVPADRRGQAQGLRRGDRAVPGAGR